MSLDIVSYAAAQAVAARQRMRPATVMAIGDSITRNGYVAGTPGQYAGTGTGGGQSYLMWAALLSKGQIRLPAVPVNATGGFKTIDMISTQDNTGTGGTNAYGDGLTHLNRVLAAKPGYCVVLGGTNDFNAAQGDIATSIANLTLIYSSLERTGITPVLCTLPPRNDISSWGEQRLNAWIMRYARDHGYPLADFFGALVDPNSSGQYLNGNPAPGVNNQDNVHPNSAGAKIMGQKVLDALAPCLPVGVPPLAQISLPGANDLINLYFGNTADPTHVRSASYTNPDGVGNRPSGWSADGGAVAQSEDVATAAPVGLYYSITRGAAGDVFRTKSFRTLTAGNRYLWAVRLKASVKGVSGRWGCYLSGPTDALCPSGIWAGNVDIAEDVPTDSVFSCEFTCRVTGNYYTKMNVKAGTGASVGVAQTALLDLTGAGIA